MTNLVFDLSNMVYRSLFTCAGYNSTTQLSFDNDSEVQQLLRKISMDIAFITRLINPSRVIFALDSKSWRKSISIEENEGYKGTRKKASNLNWDNIFKSMAEFSEIMIANGFIVSKIDMAEADDIVALWVNELLDKKQHVIAVSSDEDLRQLIQYRPNGDKYVFSTVFNPFMSGKNGSRKLYVPEKFNQWLSTDDEVDIFNMSGSIDIDKEDFRRIRGTEKVLVEEVNGNLIAMRKVFCGDDSDNVPALFSWLKEDKIFRITNSKFDKIYEMLEKTTFSKDENTINHKFLMNHSDELLEYIKIVTKESPPFNLKDRLERQIKLIVLDPTIFPVEIVNKFNELKAEHLEKPRPDIGGVSMNSLLQGTRYVRASAGGTGKGSESSIFKQIDRINSKSLF